MGVGQHTKEQKVERKVMPDKDVTDKVSKEWVDGDTASLSKCVCGAKYRDSELMIHDKYYYGEPRECPCCHRKLYFEVRVFEVE